LAELAAWLRCMSYADPGMVLRIPLSQGMDNIGVSY
jgi:hypothetical protein